MVTVGPELPPHLLAKRKRQQEEFEDTQHSQPQAKSGSSSPSSSSNVDDSKRRRTIGPAPPPAPLSEKPTSPPSHPAPNDSDSDDDFGPPLPPSNSAPQQQQQQDLLSHSSTAPPPPKAQREEWMLIPPSPDDWSARIDPTKLRNRKFNTGKGAKAPPSSKGAAGRGDIDTLWTETPEQKRQRLEDEMMGVKKPAQLVGAGDENGKRRDGESEKQNKETERRIREYNEKNRGSSLYEEYKKQVPKDKEDDPSKRAFDKEKDMGGGMKIGHVKRKEIVTKAADFGSRFAGGRYL
ncbi:MAG: hypothetical protein L6R41_006364 [Letrouitia leprolyta]|nr:MAG: hypothetical protein L6R41_006364 [Letrouitia leprolyta]